LANRDKLLLPQVVRIQVSIIWYNEPDENGMMPDLEPLVINAPGQSGLEYKPSNIKKNLFKIEIE
jgi:hypothetical protein